MNTWLKYIIFIHSYICDILLNCSNHWVNIRGKLYIYGIQENEVIYKGYYKINSHEYHMQYNHDTLVYILYACLLKLIGCEKYRTKEFLEHVSLIYKSVSVIKYARHGTSEYTIRVCNIIEDENVQYGELPMALLATIDMKYDVTRLYNALRKYMYNEMTLIFMKVLLHLKYNRIPSGCALDHLTVIEDNTMTEFVFKKYAPCS